MNLSIKMIIKKDKTDLILEGIGMISLVILFLIPLYYYSQLPDTIPIHFNIKGEPDGFGNKNTIWALPFIGLGTYLLLKYLNKHPYLFNIPIKITEENAQKQYHLISKMMHFFNTITVVFITYITYSTIQYVLGNSNGLGVFSIVIYILCIISSLALYLYYAFRKKAN